MRRAAIKDDPANLESSRYELRLAQDGIGGRAQTTARRHGGLPRRAGRIAEDGADEAWFVVKAGGRHRRSRRCQYYSRRATATQNARRDAGENFVDGGGMGVVMSDADMLQIIRRFWCLDAEMQHTLIETRLFFFALQIASIAPTPANPNTGGCI